MPYTATITQVIRDYENDKMANVTVSYTDDLKVIEKVYRISDPKYLKQIIRDQIADLERNDALNELITNPPLGVIDVSTPTTPTPNSIEILTEQKRGNLRALKNDFEIGLISKEEYNNRVQEERLELIEYILNN